MPAYKTKFRRMSLNSAWEKLAPRLGFSYDVTVPAAASSSKLWPLLRLDEHEMPRGLFGGDIWCVSTGPRQPERSDYRNVRQRTGS